MTSLPEGWTFAIEQHILKPEVCIIQFTVANVSLGIK